MIIAAADMKRLRLAESIKVILGRLNGVGSSLHHFQLMPLECGYG
jgi:hypothetical protein